MYKKRLNLFHRYTREFNPSTIVYKNKKEIGEYRKSNGFYTVWVMGIGRLGEIYKSRKEAYKAIIDNYIG